MSWVLRYSLYLLHALKKKKTKLCNITCRLHVVPDYIWHKQSDWFTAMSYCEVQWTCNKILCSYLSKKLAAALSRYFLKGKGTLTGSSGLKLLVVNKFWSSTCVTFALLHTLSISALLASGFSYDAPSLLPTAKCKGELCWPDFYISKLQLLWHHKASQWTEDVVSHLSMTFVWSCLYLWGSPFCLVVANLTL